MAVELKSYSGSEMGTVSVSDAWAVEVNTDLMHMAAVRQNNNARVGTVSTKTRSEVRGGGRKPWKQKGTGRARAGSRRSPVWRGGGTVFGPKPRSFASALNRKMSSGALASALSTAREQTIVVADKALNVDKTKDFEALLNKLELSGQKVLVLAERNDSLYRATRNLPKVSVVNPKNVGVVDVLKHEYILVSADALQLLEGRFNA